MSKFNYDLESLHQFHRAGELETARRGYLDILRINPREAAALHALGIIAAQEQKFSEAIEYLESAIKITPQDPMIYLHLANVLKIQGLFSQAAQILQNTLAINPNYPPAINNLGTVFFAQGKLEEAAKQYQLAIQKQPHYVDAYYNLGLALTKLGKLSEATDTYQKILKQAPEHFAARFHLACVFMLQDKLPEALTEFLNIEKTHPHHIETQSNLATCFLKQGNFNDAKLHYLKALELAPEDNQILFNLGVINMQQGHTDSAIQFYQRVVKNNPDFFAAHNNLGVAFLAKQHAAFALHHFREALRIQPANTAIQYTVNVLSQHQHLLAAPPDYVQSLFDGYADHYEPHLLTALEYQVPNLLIFAIQKIKKLPQKSWDILDLGCGTGLCGVPFHSAAKTLIGVDLSTKMLAVAAQKNIYDELISADLVAFLKNKHSAYDLIMAGDVLVYLGDLDDIFKNIYSALRIGGLFAFNAEMSEQSDFKMNQSGRFSHHKNYLDKMAEKNHFKIAHYEVAVTRMQNNEPVSGHLYVLQRALA
jgi:predicted TPR repeat methyltransferase